MTMAVASAAAPTNVEGQLSNLSTDLNGGLRVTSVGGALPTGASTAANQTSVIGTKAPGTAATNSELVGGVYTSAGLTLTNGQQAALQMNSKGSVIFTGGSQMPTYSVGGTGYTAYATPTDLLTVSGSASKTILVTRLSIFIQSTASALQTIYFIKRSTANTGGTFTNPALIPYDSNNAAATSVVTLYTVIPTTGNSLGNLRVQTQASSTVANGGAQIDAYTSATLGTTISLVQPITLRGAAESLCINYAGAALTVGFTATWLVEVVEI